MSSFNNLGVIMIQFLGASGKTAEDVINKVNQQVAEVFEKTGFEITNVEFFDVKSFGDVYTGVAPYQAPLPDKI